MLPTVSAAPLAAPKPAVQTSTPAPAAVTTSASPAAAAPSNNTISPANQTVAQTTQNPAVQDDAAQANPQAVRSSAEQQAEKRREDAEATKILLTAQVGVDRVDEVVDANGNIDYQRLAEIRQERFASGEAEEDDSVPIGNVDLGRALSVDILA